MYTEVKSINIKSGESIGHMAPGGLEPTYTLPPGVYTASWFAAGQRLTFDLECSGSTQYVVDNSILAGSIDILVEHCKVTFAINTLLQFIPSSYISLLNHNRFKTTPGTLLKKGDDPSVIPNTYDRGVVADSSRRKPLASGGGFWAP